MTDPTPADIPSLVAEKLLALVEARQMGGTVREGEKSGTAARRFHAANIEIASFIGENWPIICHALDALSPKEDAFAGAGKPIGEDAVGGGEPCGGCGATSNSQRCIGCMHDFGTPESAWVRAHTPSTPAVEGIPAGMVAGGWQSMSTAPKDGTLLELVVDYTDGDHPLQDAIIAPTIGYNGLDDTGEDEWKFAGWCWTHDHFTEGRGTVIAWRPSRLNANGDDGSLGPLDTYTPQARPTASDGEAREALDALRWLRAFWKPGSNHDTEEVKHALATADAVLAKADAILAALPTSDGAAMRAAPTWLEERPDDKGGFDEFVARFADGMVHAEMMNDKGLYIGLYRDDGRIYQFWVSSDKKLTCHGESSDGPATPPTTDPSERMREALEAVAGAMLNGGDGAVGDFGWNVGKLNKARPLIRAAPTPNEVSDEG